MDPSFVVVNVFDGSVVFSAPTDTNCNGVYKDEDPSLYPLHAYIYVTCGGTPSTPGTLYTFSVVNPGGWPQDDGKFPEEYVLVDQQPLPSMARMGTYVPSTRTLYVSAPAIPAGKAFGRAVAQPAQVVAFQRNAGTGKDPSTECFATTGGMSKGGAASLTFILTAGFVGAGTWMFADRANKGAKGGKSGKGGKAAVADDKGFETAGRSPMKPKVNKQGVLDFRKGGKGSKGFVLGGDDKDSDFV